MGYFHSTFMPQDALQWHINNLRIQSVFFKGVQTASPFWQSASWRRMSLKAFPECSWAFTPPHPTPKWFFSQVISRHGSLFITVYNTPSPFYSSGKCSSLHWLFLWPQLFSFVLANTCFSDWDFFFFCLSYLH